MYESNKIEMEKRILEVSKMLLSGLSTKEICYNAILKWDISESQIKRYIRRCYTLWHQDFRKKRKAGLDYHLAKRRDLYKKAYDKKDWKTCLEIAKDEAKIMDIYPTEKIKHDVEFTYAEWMKAMITKEKERK